MAEPIIDAATFESLTDAMGVDFMGELIDTYCDDTPQLIVQLQQALEQGDAEGFRRLAHSIKSSSASMGALNFAMLARDLEMIGKSGDLTGSAEKVNQLESEFESVVQALMELKNEP